LRLSGYASDGAALTLVVGRFDGSQTRPAQWISILGQACQVSHTDVICLLLSGPGRCSVSKVMEWCAALWLGRARMCSSGRWRTAECVSIIVPLLIRFSALRDERHLVITNTPTHEHRRQHSPRVPALQCLYSASTAPGF
jgi:hypothetical protein